MVRRVGSWYDVVAAMVVKVAEVEILCLTVLCVEEEYMVVMGVDEIFGRVLDFECF